MLKLCPGCGYWKLLRNFHEDSTKNDREFKVMSRCAKCRSENYYKKRYSTVCAQCKKPRRLFVNGVCKKCNEKAGLRECSKCHSILCAPIDFYGRKRVCKKCLKEKPPVVPGA